eukprot:2575919-Rhodomonas_salina.2
MSGTDIVRSYQPQLRCLRKAVRSAICLRARYAMSSTNTPYAAPPCYAVSGTDIPCVSTTR